jgi:hypothetical protein
MNNSCNYLYIISKYIVSILQIMNVVFADKYTNNLITTKCLNTAVMIIVLTLGDKKIPNIQYCDVSNTIQRHGLNQDNNVQIFNKMKKSIVRKLTQNSVSNTMMYYIMLTDGTLNSSISNGSDKYFPGHVFILEKTIDKNNTLNYRIYQSYIAKYSLHDHLNKTKCKVFEIDEIKPLLIFFKNFLSPDYVWNNETVYYWKLLTNVDSSEFIGYKTDNIFLCYKLFKSNSILKNLKQFVNIHLNLIKKYEKENPTYYYREKQNWLSSQPKDIKILKKDFMNMQKELNSKN